MKYSLILLCVLVLVFIIEFNWNVRPFKFIFNKRYLLIISLCFFIVSLTYLNIESTYKIYKYSILLCLLLLISIHDIRSKTIENKHIVFGIVILVCINILEFYKIRNFDFIKDSLVGGGSAIIIMFILFYFIKDGVGFGDVKLLGMLGLYLGFQEFINVLLISSILSGVIGLGLVIFKKLDRKAMIPYAPFVFISCIVSILL